MLELRQERLDALCCCGLKAHFEGATQMLDRTLLLAGPRIGFAERRVDIRVVWTQLFSARVVADRFCGGLTTSTPCLEDREYMRQHDALRRKYFLPVKLLSHYVSALQVAGLPVLEITRQTIEARVDEWFNFLAVYHEGVVGWLGGARKLVGREPADDVVRDRFSLMRLAMERVFAGKPTFKTCWTYLVCERSA